MTTTEQQNTLLNLGEWHTATPQVSEHPSGVIIAQFVKPGNTFEYAVFADGVFDRWVQEPNSKDALLDEWIDRFERKQRMVVD